MVGAGGAIYLSRANVEWWQAWFELIGGLLVARLSYLGAVAQARSYAQRIRSAADLYRFDLLKALHLDLPNTPGAERNTWESVSKWLYNNDRGAVQGLAYNHYEASKKEESKPPEPSGLLAFLKRLWPGA
jgi:hypothetical protein